MTDKLKNKSGLTAALDITDQFFDAIDAGIEKINFAAILHAFGASKELVNKHKNEWLDLKELDINREQAHTAILNLFAAID